MSYIKRDRMLDEMFKDIASREEKLKVDELYQLGFKGSAVVYMTKRILRNWNAMLGKDTRVEPINLVRTIKITKDGVSRLEVMS